MRPKVLDNPQGLLAAGSKFQGRVHKTYLGILKRKDHVNFGTTEGAGGTLEIIFRQFNFKPLVFGTFGELSSNVIAIVETAVEYGVEHLGRNMVATIVDARRSALRRRYKSELAMAA